MSRTRETTVLPVVKLFRCNLPVLAICLTSLAAVPAQGQKVSHSPNSATNSNSCEGNQPQQTSSQAPASDAQAAAEESSERLKLSTREAEESPDPTGQFCRRDRSEQKSLRPSNPSERPDTTPPPAQPVADRYYCRRTGHSWLDLQLDLWKALDDTVTRWGQGCPVDDDRCPGQ